MASEGASREQVENLHWVIMKALTTASALLGLAVLRNWSMFLNFSCFCSLAQLSQCTCQDSICPSRASSDIPSLGGLFILLHHLLTRAILRFAALTGWICQYHDNYYIVFPCLFPHLFESLWKTGNMSLSALHLQFPLEGAGWCRVCLEKFDW